MTFVAFLYRTIVVIALLVMMFQEDGQTPQKAIFVVGVLLCGVITVSTVEITTAIKENKRGL